MGWSIRTQQYKNAVFKAHGKERYGLKYNGTSFDHSKGISSNIKLTSSKQRYQRFFICAFAHTFPEWSWMQLNLIHKYNFFFSFSRSWCAHCGLAAPFQLTRKTKAKCMHKIIDMDALFLPCNEYCILHWLHLSSHFMWSLRFGCFWYPSFHTTSTTFCFLFIFCWFLLHFIRCESRSSEHNFC